MWQAYAVCLSFSLVTNEPSRVLSLFLEILSES